MSATSAGCAAGLAEARRRFGPAASRMGRSQGATEAAIAAFADRATFRPAAEGLAEAARRFAVPDHQPPSAAEEHE